MGVTICHASLSENCTITGKAGDQNGKEVCTRGWYSKPWTIMLRHRDPLIAKKACEIAKKLADSNLVGYDQNERNTLYAALKKYDFDVDKYIKSGEKTETDCSAFIYAVYCCVIPSLRSDSNAPTTSTMRTKFANHGFTAHTDKKYLITDGYLNRGDILIRPGSHTVLAITDGNYESGHTCYPKCTLNTSSLITALNHVGEMDVSKAHRKKIAEVNGLPNYNFTAEENLMLLAKLKSGTLIKT